MANILTDTQIDKIKNDILDEISFIDSTNIGPEEKIPLLLEFTTGYEKGFEMVTGFKFNVREIPLLSNIEADIQQFGEQLGHIEPGEDPKVAIQQIALSYWQDIVNRYNTERSGIIIERRQ